MTSSSLLTTLPNDQQARARLSGPLLRPFARRPSSPSASGQNCCSRSFSCQQRRSVKSLSGCRGGSTDILARQITSILLSTPSHLRRLPPFVRRSFLIMAPPRWPTPKSTWNNEDDLLLCTQLAALAHGIGGALGCRRRFSQPNLVACRYNGSKPCRRSMLSYKEVASVGEGMSFQVTSVSSSNWRRSAHHEPHAGRLSDPLQVRAVLSLSRSIQLSCADARVPLDVVGTVPPRGRRNIHRRANQSHRRRSAERNEAVRSPIEVVERQRLTSTPLQDRDRVHLRHAF